jgi:septal ring factor EnvC (AmiA/AmiB activator)
MIPTNTGYFQPNQEHYQTYTQMQNSQQLQQLQQFLQHLQQQIQNQTVHSSQHLNTLSTSKEEIENPRNDNTWQVVKRVKRRKTSSNQKQEQGNLTLNNKYSSLSQDEDIDTDKNKPEIITPKPPPIFV